MATDSILTSIKKDNGITEEQTHFDDELVRHINSAFMILNQLAVGPKKPFVVKDKSETWPQFFGDRDEEMEAVKGYVFMKVKLLFDPPANSFTIASYERLISEFEWRANVQAEGADIL